MPTTQLIRVGSMGHVGRFAAADAIRYPRRSRVIVRTQRGLETGEVLADSAPGAASTDGAILRPMTAEDHLLLARLERNRSEAFAACCEQLRQRGIAAVLMDVEQLFDAESIYFYFLGEVTPELESLTAELAETYEAKVQFRQFAEAVTAGCGPDCGTEDAAGCGSCGTGCAVAAACGSGRG